MPFSRCVLDADARGNDRLAEEYRQLESSGRLASANSLAGPALPSVPTGTDVAKLISDQRSAISDVCVGDCLRSALFFKVHFEQSSLLLFHALSFFPLHSTLTLHFSP